MYSSRQADAPWHGARTRCAGGGPHPRPDRRPQPQDHPNLRTPGRPRPHPGEATLKTLTLRGRARSERLRMDQRRHVGHLAEGDADPAGPLAASQQGMESGTASRRARSRPGVHQTLPIHVQRPWRRRSVRAERVDSPCSRAARLDRSLTSKIMAKRAGHLLADDLCRCRPRARRCATPGSVKAPQCEERQVLWWAMSRTKRSGRCSCFVV